MPWTPSHAAAVLPFRRLCPKYLNFPALVAGSMAPDLGYYIGQFDLSEFAHTLPGSIVASVPLGAALLLIFYGVRRPLWFLLPQPHRSAVEPLLHTRPAMDAAGILAIVASLLIGGWTHVLWDCFTHSSTWIVDRVALLQAPWIRLGDVEVFGFTVLQDLSTAAGAAALGIAYFAWLRRQPRKQRSDDTGDRWRYAALFGKTLLSALIALSMALDATAAAQVSPRIVVVQAAFYGGSTFALLLAVYSAGYFLLRNKT